MIDWNSLTCSARIAVAGIAIGLVFIGAGLMRIYDQAHIAPLIIGQAIPGVPCMITDEAVKNCDFSGLPSWPGLASSMQLGRLTIIQAPPGIEPGHKYQKDEYGGLHQLPPAPTY